MTVSVNAGDVSYGDGQDISILAYDDELAAGVLHEVARADQVHGMPAVARARQDNLAVAAVVLIESEPTS